ncbi:hypothetical protein B0H17DRAFT_1337157 [Mycena rosella]|uniref:Uncharacterized protein n=1 Tax=Mycena rosella TaxID=1033263 RepID=A0AAD7CT54_MYCRO|nr:hypothetical protein B0H17DRAFT_1337157 [Mycena rosella]
MAHSKNQIPCEQAVSRPTKRQRLIHIRNSSVGRTALEFLLSIIDRWSSPLLPCTHISLFLPSVTLPPKHLYPRSLSARMRPYHSLLFTSASLFGLGNPVLTKHTIDDDVIRSGAAYSASRLGYQNTTLSNELHTLLITPNITGDSAQFGDIIYSSDDEETPPNASNIPSSTRATPGSSTPPPPTPAPSLNKPRSAAIAGGVVGALVTLVAFLLIARALMRRRARRRTGFSRGNLKSADGEKPWGPPSDVEAARSTASPGPPSRTANSAPEEDATPAHGERDPSLLAEQVRVLEAQLQAAPQGSEAASSSTTAGARPRQAGASVSRSVSMMKRE